MTPVWTARRGLPMSEYRARIRRRRMSGTAGLRAGCRSARQCSTRNYGSLGGVEVPLTKRRRCSRLVENNEGGAMTRWAVAATLASAMSVLAVPGVVSAAAQPPGNDNWLTLQGQCDGQPATLLDPKGGNTAFLVGGSVGVGKIFTWMDAAHPDVILQQSVNGRGVDPARLTTCRFLFEGIDWPGLGLIDVIFQVQG